MNNLRERIKKRLETGLELHHETYHPLDTLNANNLLNSIMEEVEQALLGMEGLKEEETWGAAKGMSYHATNECKQDARNELRKEIKAEIEELLK